MNGTGIRIEWDSRELTTALDRATQRQLPFAIAVALTRTGQVIKAAEISEMRRVFDRPTPFTLNSLMLRPATKQRQYAEVWFKDFAPKGTPAAKYLLPQVRGGGRRNKRFEGALRHGGVLGQDEYAIPARGAPKDSYGNVRRGIYQRILSDLGSSRDAAQNSKGAGRFFVGTIGRTRGIFQPGTTRNLKMMFIFTRAPAYESRFAFFEVAARVQSQNYALEFTRAMDIALATAR